MRIKIVGNPQIGSVIICNHQSAFDCILIAIAAPGTIFLFRESLWVSWLLKSLGMVGVGRSKTWLTESLATEKDRSICVFPEGRRVHPWERPEYRSGFSVIAQHARRHIQTAIITGAGKYWGKKLIPSISAVYGQIELHFGKLYKPTTPIRKLKEYINKYQTVLEGKANSWINPKFCDIPQERL